MDEKRKVLLWLGGGQIEQTNFNFEKYDEVIFIDALKHICWEIESFISQKGISAVSYTHLTLPTNREV